jgi:hypothetical protein
LPDLLALPPAGGEPESEDDRYPAAPVFVAGFVTRVFFVVRRIMGRGSSAKGRRVGEKRQISGKVNASLGMRARVRPRFTLIASEPAPVTRLSL